MGKCTFDWHLLHGNNILLFLSPAGVLLREDRSVQPTQLNATRDNSITTPNIYTVQGPRGRDGRDGVPGRDGRDGQHGAPGSKGERGDTGLQGQSGPQGSYALQFLIQYYSEDDCSSNSKFCQRCYDSIFTLS